jgi:opacity protein-like surface antigen
VNGTHLSLVAAALVVAAPGAAAAESYVRVISQKAPVHTGPGHGYRESYVAERGEVFEVEERGTRGFWFRIRLEDGTSGWVLGELVYPFEFDETVDKPGFFARTWKSIRRGVLGPPPIVSADVEISFSAGVLDNEGLFLLRPAWVIDPYFAIEAFGGLSPRAEKDIFLGGLGWTLRLIPGAYVGPYLNAGVGAAHSRPKTDNELDVTETVMALAVGGGLEITFKKQITLRLDARNWTLFDPDKAANGQEYSGGLAIFF